MIFEYDDIAGVKHACRVRYFQRKQMALFWNDSHPVPNLRNCIKAYAAMQQLSLERTIWIESFRVQEMLCYRRACIDTNFHTLSVLLTQEEFFELLDFELFDHFGGW